MCDICTFPHAIRKFRPKQLSVCGAPRNLGIEAAADALESMIRAAAASAPGDAVKIVVDTVKASDAAALSNIKLLEHSARAAITEIENAAEARSAGGAVSGAAGSAYGGRDKPASDKAGGDHDKEESAPPPAAAMGPRKTTFTDATPAPSTTGARVFPAEKHPSATKPISPSEAWASLATSKPATQSAPKVPAASSSAANSSHVIVGGKLSNVGPAGTEAPQSDDNDASSFAAKGSPTAMITTLYTALLSQKSEDATLSITEANSLCLYGKLWPLAEEWMMQLPPHGRFKNAINKWGKGKLICSSNNCTLWPQGNEASTISQPTPQQDITRQQLKVVEFPPEKKPLEKKQPSIPQQQRPQQPQQTPLMQEFQLKIDKNLREQLQHAEDVKETKQEATRTKADAESHIRSIPALSEQKSAPLEQWGGKDIVAFRPTEGLSLLGFRGGGGFGGGFSVPLGGEDDRGVLFAPSTTFSDDARPLGLKGSSPAAPSADAASIQATEHLAQLQAVEVMHDLERASPGTVPPLLLENVRKLARGEGFTANSAIPSAMQQTNLSSYTLRSLGSAASSHSTEQNTSIWQ